MRKALTVLLAVCVVGSAFAGNKAKPQVHRIDKNRNIAILGDEAVPLQLGLKPQRAASTNAIGPGTKLMDSEYDYGSNGGVPTNIVVYNDGTIAVGRMGATVPATTADRGTFFSYFDGTTWSPMTKVEQARRGWSSIAALADGRSVTASHVATEVNVDALKGFGIWTSSVTGNAPGGTGQWPRMTVDGKDNIIIVSTSAAAVSGIGSLKQAHVSRDGGSNWTNTWLYPDTSVSKPSFGADDQSIASQGDKVALLVVDAFGDLHLWTSTDNATTWTYKQLTNNPATLPAGTSADYPAGSGDIMYDNAGNIHIFWETFLARPDSAGTGIDFFESTTSGIYHWSEASGATEIVDFNDIPGGAQDTTVFAVAGAFDQHNIDGNVVCQPQAGIDAAGNIYMLFTAFRPNDLDGDGLHFTDVYAVASNDGGKTWGEPVNVTDTPQSEDTWPSLAKNIGTDLQFVYSSDGVTGNSIQGGGTAPTTYLYHTFPKANIPFGSSSVNDRPGEVPTAFALHAAYPNPFNPSTKIAFDLTKAVQVKLSVYDVNGKLVATLVNGKLEAGKHSVSWNAKGQPSGVYFAKLEAEGLSQVQKMTLVK